MTLRRLSRRAALLPAATLAVLLAACTMPKKPETPEHIISLDVQQGEEAPTIQIDRPRPPEPDATPPGPDPVKRPAPGGEYDHPIQRLSTPAPPMPPAAIEQEIQGRVLLDLIVDEDGRVSQSVVVSSVHPLLTEAAQEAVRRWTFRPMTRGGQPVVFRLRQSFRFVLAE